MRSVGIKVLKNKLSEYVRLADAGETILVTDRNRVVAELVPPTRRADVLRESAFVAQGVREGWLAPAARPCAVSPPVLARAMEPFPVPVRTLEALHLATLDFLRGQGKIVTLAGCDACQL